MSIKMTQPLTAHHAVKWIGPILLYDPSPQERLWAARALAHHSRDHWVYELLLYGLQDHNATVRCEVYKILSKIKFYMEEWPDLLDLARLIRRSLELEHAGEPAWYAGVKALDRLSDYYESNYMYLNKWYVETWTNFYASLLHSLYKNSIQPG